MATSNKSRLAGWILSGLVAAFLIGPSAVGKFVEWEGKAKMFEHLGFSSELITKIGVLEIVLAMPRQQNLWVVRGIEEMAYSIRVI